MINVDFNIISNVIILSYLIYIAYKDYQKLIVTNTSLVYLIVIFIVRDVVLKINYLDILWALLINLVIFVGLYILPKKCIGAGDVKLALVLALWCNYPQCILAIYISFITGGIVSIIYLLKLYLIKNMKLVNIYKYKVIPFAPILIWGNVIAYYKANSIWQFWCGLLGL